MPIIDIIIGIAIIISVIVGFLRGFVKEAISIATLLFAIWASLYFGPPVGSVSESWLQGAELQTWFGRILVFTVILSLGGLLGWGLSKLIKLSVLSGLDRFGGSVFGLLRGILLVALGVLGGQVADFDKDPWWRSSTLIPHFAVLAEWIEEMAPAGYDLLVPDEPADSVPISLPGVRIEDGKIEMTGSS